MNTVARSRETNQYDEEIVLRSAVHKIIQFGRAPQLIGDTQERVNSLLARTNKNIQGIQLDVFYNSLDAHEKEVFRTVIINILQDRDILSYKNTLERDIHLKIQKFIWFILNTFSLDNELNDALIYFFATTSILWDRHYKPILPTIARINFDPIDRAKRKIVTELRRREGIKK